MVRLYTWIMNINVHYVDIVLALFVIKEVGLWCTHATYLIEEVVIFM